MEDTLRFLLDQLTPEDNPQNDTDHHKEARRQVEPINTRIIKISRRKKLGG